MKKWFDSAIYGMGIGFPITLAVMTFFREADPIIKECAVWAAASALYGLVSRLVFRRERPLPVELSIYALVGCLITLVGGALCGYLHSTRVMLTMILSFIVIFAVITTLAFLSQKWEEKQANKKLKQD